MKKIIFFFVFIAFIENSKAQEIKAQSPAGYNNFFADSQQLLLDGVFKLNKNIGLYGSDSIQEDLKYLQLTARQVLLDAQRIETYDGGQRLKSAYMALFEYYNEAFNNEFPGLVKIYTKSDATDMDNKHADTLLNYLTETEIQLEKECDAARDEFAATHGFVTRKTGNKFQFVR